MSGFTLDWLQLIVLFGAVQGVFLTVALAARRSNRVANRLLAGAMFSFSLYLASFVYHAAHLETRWPHFFGLGYPTPLIFGPLVYLYAVAAADRDRPFTGRDWLHFLPFALTVLGSMPVYLMSGPEKLAWYQRLLAGDSTLLTRLADPLKYVSGLGYSVATVRFLAKHREQIKDSYSTTERVNLRWLVWLGGFALLIWVIASGVGVLHSNGIAFALGEDIISLLMAILVYSIGYMGLRQPEVFRFNTAEWRIPKAPAAAPAAGASTASESDDARYERSGLSEFEARRLKAALLETMEKQRPWSDSELNLADLAELLRTSPHKLSEVLNSEVGETFYDFVNGYRVREVQRRIEAGEAKTRKILSLALDAGFASKSTFNQVFKKHTSRTPSDYRQAAGA